MKIVSVEESLRPIQDFFFKAMLHGYASLNPGKTLISGMAGYKSIIFTDGKLRLVDAWCSNAFSQKSAGTTTIFFDSQPVWVMHYEGYYPEASTIISLLKRALRIAYEDNNFRGGRGMGCTEGGYFYVNDPLLNSFSLFRGREEIKSWGNGEIIGFHEYQGMSLI